MFCNFVQIQTKQDEVEETVKILLAGNYCCRIKSSRKIVVDNVK